MSPCDALTQIVTQLISIFIPLINININKTITNSTGWDTLQQYMWLEEHKIYTMQSYNKAH